MKLLFLYFIIMKLMVLNWNTAICKVEEELQVRWSKESDGRSPKQAVWNHSLLLGRRWTCRNLRYPKSLTFWCGASACRDIIRTLQIICASFDLRRIIADHGGGIRRRIRKSNFLLTLLVDGLLLEIGSSCLCCCFCLRSCSCGWSHGWIYKSEWMRQALVGVG